MFKNITRQLHLIIKSLLKNIWLRTKDRMEYRKDVVFYSVLVLGVFGLLIPLFLFYSEGLILAGNICSVQIVILIGTIYLYSIRKKLLAKNISIILINTTFFIIASSTGRGLPMYINFIPIVSATLFFYNSSQIKYTVFMLLFTFSSLVVLECTDYSLFKTVEIIYTSQQFFIHVLVSLFVSILLGGIMIRELLLMNIYEQRSLDRINVNLMRQNEKLIKTNMELDSFAYRSSHDLRSPLTSIMGMINIIKMESDILKIQEYMLLQERSVKKLDGLVNDILKISRNSRMEVQYEHIALNAFMTHCIEELDYLVEKKKVKIKIDIPETVVCYSDANRLKVIFMNILSNAFRYHDYSKEESTLVISAIEDAGIKLLFEDNGIGIKEAHVPKVFDMFYRGTDRNNGAGLGLYIAKEAITKIGGQLSVTSTYGKGASVVVTLPALHS